MTKKHYEAIAVMIQNALHVIAETKHAKTTVRLHAYNLADYFATDNPKFNRTMFLAACGIETKKECPHIVGHAVYKDRKMQGILCHQCGKMHKAPNQK